MHSSYHGHIHDRHQNKGTSRDPGQRSRASVHPTRAERHRSHETEGQETRSYTPTDQRHSHSTVLSSASSAPSTLNLLEASNSRLVLSSRTNTQPSSALRRARSTQPTLADKHHETHTCDKPTTTQPPRSFSHQPPTDGVDTLYRRQHTGRARPRSATKRFDSAAHRLARGLASDGTAGARNTSQTHLTIKPPSQREKEVAEITRPAPKEGPPPGRVTLLPFHHPVPRLNPPLRHASGRRKNLTTPLPLPQHRLPLRPPLHHPYPGKVV